MRLSSLLPFLKENITFAATLLSKFIDLFIFHPEVQEKNIASVWKHFCNKVYRSQNFKVY